MSYNKKDFLTPGQIAQIERQNSICTDFLEAYRQYPDFSAFRIIATIAERHALTAQGVKTILAKRGIYKPNSGNPIIMDPQKEDSV